MHSVWLYLPNVHKCFCFLSWQTMTDYFLNSNCYYANFRFKLELVEADLMQDEGWQEAVRDCTYVIHMASPFPAANPSNEEEVIRPAVDGTVRVLRAAQQVGGVKRVVLTSSIASISGGFIGGNKVFTEEDWTNTDDPSLLAYVKSKTLAEQAAWDFVNKLEEVERFELAVINPVFVMGPVLCGSFATSMEVVQRLLEHAMPALPRLNFPVTDVRDVATAHIRAMLVTEAAGNRHIISSGTMWMHEIAKVVDDEFRSLGYSVPTMTVPKIFVVINSLFDSSLKSILPSINKVTEFDNSKMRNVLSLQPTDMKKTIIDMCYSMIESGHVKKTEQYKKACTIIE